MKIEKNVTLKDIAKASGFSQATISRVMGGHRNVSKEVREKVLQTAKELGYTPSLPSRNDKKELRKSIGVIVESSGIGFFFQIVDAIEKKCSERGYDVILCNSQSDVSIEAQKMRALARKKVDGIIISSVQRYESNIEHVDLPLYSGRTPIVYVDKKIDGIRELFIGSDHFSTAAEATEYLLNFGHQHIGVISCPDSDSLHQRVSGYKNRLEAYGIPFREEYIRWVSGFTVDPGAEAVQDLLKKFPQITAFITLSDLITLGALRGLRKCGKRIPEDCSLLGWDDFEAAEMITPPLTMVKQETNKIGEMAAERLIEMLEAKNEGEPWLGESQIMLKTQLIKRESCGPVPGKLLRD